MTTLKHFAILLFGIRTMARQRCTSCRFRCMRFSARLRSRLIYEHVWNSEATACDAFYALGLTIVSTSIVQRCVYSQEWCTNFWGRKMVRMLRCECCATMRLLLDVWHVILQRCTTVEHSTTCGSRIIWIILVFNYIYLSSVRFW